MAATAISAQTMSSPRTPTSVGIDDLYTDARLALRSIYHDEWIAAIRTDHLSSDNGGPWNFRSFPFDAICGPSGHQLAAMSQDRSMR